MKFIILLNIFLISLAKSYESVEQARPSIYGTLKNVGCPIEIVPGQKIGPLKIGMNVEEVKYLGMDIKSVENFQRLFIIGKYTVYLNEDNNIRNIEMEIGDVRNCIKYGKKKIKQNTTVVELARVFKNCDKDEVYKGGRVVRCEKVSIGSGGWGGRQKTPSIKI